jgi:REP element-mobilizing transposase RayT
MRLPQYDYSQNGAYFVTVCTHQRKHLLSQIVGDGFHPVPLIALSPIGQEVLHSIQFMNDQYNGIIEKHVIMPNHVHLLVLLQAGGHGNPPLQDIVGRLKSYTTKRFNEMGATNDAILWQRSFHDHILRTEDEYAEVWQYIDTNPLQWETDTYYGI